jgi:hypothetical protein
MNPDQFGPWGSLRPYFADGVKIQTKGADAVVALPKFQPGGIKFVGNIGGEVSNYTMFKNNTSFDPAMKEFHVGGGIGYGNFARSNIRAIVGNTWRDVVAMYPAPSNTQPLGPRISTPFARVDIQAMKGPFELQATGQYNFTATGDWLGKPATVGNNWGVGGKATYWFPFLEKKLKNVRIGVHAFGSYGQHAVDYLGTSFRVNNPQVGIGGSAQFGHN